MMCALCGCREAVQQLQQVMCDFWRNFRQNLAMIWPPNPPRAPECEEAAAKSVTCLKLYLVIFEGLLRKYWFLTVLQHCQPEGSHQEKRCLAGKKYTFFCNRKTTGGILVGLQDKLRKL